MHVLHFGPPLPIQFDDKQKFQKTYVFLARLALFKNEEYIYFSNKNRMKNISLHAQI